VESLSSYGTETALATGAAPNSVAPSAFFNRLFRQSSVMAAMIGNFIAAEGGNANDDGNMAELLAAYEAALITFIDSSNNVWSGSNTFSETADFSAGIISNGVDAGAANIRMVGGNYGAMFQNNGTSFYLLLTNSGNAYGLYNGFRPLSVTLATGAMLIDQSGAGVTFGGPVTANGLLTAEALTVTGGVLFDSSANLAGGAIISDGNPFTSSTSEVPNENWVQGAIGNARTTLFPHGLQAFTASGNVTFVVPSNVYYMEWIVTGGGGGGANCVSGSGNYVSGGGGGAGATAISVVAVTPGQTLTGFVGAGGASLSNGQASSLGALSAGGGAASSYSGPTTAAGGGGGTASGGQINIPGGLGSDGQQGGLIFAGNGGGSIWGGGGRAGAHAGVAGYAPGSGGGGAYDSTSSGTNYPGGNGAAGAIVLKW
jgi:hypothetical protein